MSTSQKTPIWFWIVSGLSFVWNMMGVGAFVMQMQATPEQILADYGQVQADIIAAQPAWYPFVFGAAVFGGAIGCLLLLLRKKLASLFLMISLLAVILQNVYFAMSGVFSKLHGGQWVMTLMIPVVALFLVWFAKKMTAKGVLS